ncbi:MAG: heme utilization cystosolic carrier protein HutX [Deltaproteobacteria bacterium]|nr:MAG: heme utilization cystosolic carrier protein HutX [Deltaproteobacteria bacterium]PIE74910.1 MAG: heme utilization cystosolic carrier protein HutX [Deltaproteobacteria bacterium]
MSNENQDIKAKVREILDKNESTMPINIAKELNLSEEEVVRAFPEKMITFVEPGLFDEIWNDMTEWEKITFICQTPSAVIEVKGKLPKGKYGHGFFNMMDKDNPLGGHLSVDLLGSICFLEKPFFGLESLSVQFYDKQGNHMFSVYAGREKKDLIQDVKERFYALREKVKTKGNN